jgi:DNA-binding transcriptional ArsR family regulator
LTEEDRVTEEDRLNVDDLKLPPEMARERSVGIPKRIQKRQQQFVKLPLTLVDKVARHSRDKIFAVLCHLLHLEWKQGGGPIKLPNGLLDKLGVGRGAKYRALRKLERLGIVSVERQDRKSPIVTINGNEERSDKIVGINTGKGSPVPVAVSRGGDK